MEIDLNLNVLILCSIVMFVAATIQCTIGMGGALIAAPIIAVVLPELLPAPLILNGAVMTTLVAMRERARIQWKTLPTLLPSAILGIILGSALLTFLTGNHYVFLIGLLLIVTASMSYQGLQIKVNTKNSVVAGGLCGFMHSTVSLPGPPIILLFQNERSNIFRPTVAAYLTITSIISLASLYAIGRLGTRELQLAIMILPGTLLGYVCSRFFIGNFQTNKIKSLVIFFASISGLLLIIKSLM